MEVFRVLVDVICIVLDGFATIFEVVTRMIRSMQVRAARGLVGFSQTELSRRAGVGLATLQRLEAAGTEFRGTAQTLDRLQRTLEAAGVEFLEQSQNSGPGVRLRDPISTS